MLEEKCDMENIERWKQYNMLYKKANALLGIYGNVITKWKNWRNRKYCKLIFRENKIQKKGGVLGGLYLSGEKPEVLKVEDDEREWKVNYMIFVNEWYYWH